MSENHFKDLSGEGPNTDSSKVSNLAQPPELSSSQVAPQTILQQVLSTVWAESLGIEKIGIRDDFFELGGASVVATQIVSRLRQMFQMELPAVLMFEAPTVEKFARYMIEHEARPGLTEKTATLLKQIEGMTEDQVARSLSSE